MMNGRVGLALVGLTPLFATQASAQRAATSNQSSAPTVKGTAVVHMGPIQTDTLPTLYRDAARPEPGFLTDPSDTEWHHASI